MGRTLLLSLLTAISAFAAANDAAESEFFESRIRPILVRRCYACHSSATPRPMAGIRLDTRDETRRVTSDSRLLRAVNYEGAVKMPPAAKLPSNEIADLAEWIRMGAPDPRDAARPASKTLWSLQPVKDPLPPKVKDAAWSRSPIDAFVLAKLEQRGLSPAPPADKRTLIRRVSLDLTGLPPTPAEIEAFLADDSREAYPRLVDRLLASPRYGERWARHWLDLVRFAETNGHEFDNDKLAPWRYRDYVIRAFNQDVPYDQFVREHIAGDLLPNPRLTLDGHSLESPLGTSFYWFGEVLNSATDPVKSRADEVDNQIDVASKAFLGLTVACARCHDHKFDPISTADYYALAGVFHSTAMRETVIDSPERARAIRSLRGAPPSRAKAMVHYRPEDEVFDNFENGFGKWVNAGAAFGDGPVNRVADSLAAGSDSFTGTLISHKFRTSEKRYLHFRFGGTPVKESPNERGLLRFTLVNGEHKSQHAVPAGIRPVWKTMELVLERNRICYFEIVDRTRDGHIAVEQIVFSDLKTPPPTDEPPPPLGDSSHAHPDVPESEFAMIAADETPHNVRVHIRGSHESLGAEVPRGFLRVITGENPPTITQGSGRLQVAQWFAGEHNPLTARVMANRIWKHHFAQGIVRTPDNFGIMGEPPTHPELLDYLAARFVENGWSVKAMHRLILLSNAYQISSRAPADAARVDPENKLLSHANVRRLEPEAIRDSILAVAGTLNPEMYGPSVPPHISKYQDGRGKPTAGPADGNGRRSIYIQVRRNFITPLFLAFDYPLPSSSIGARSVSTVPSQALLMMNNEFVAGQATAWSRSVIAAHSSSRDRVNAMYRAAFARPPEPAEIDEVISFVGKQGGSEQAWAAVAHVLLNSAELIYVP